jgi:hypothetical protein
MQAFVIQGRKDRQRGQSLVETCVACIVLIPVAIGVMYVGQYIHMKQVTQMTAREAAWDAAASPQLYGLQALDTSGEQTRLQARNFADPGAAIQTGASVPGTFADTLLVDYAGQQMLQTNKLTLSVYQNNQTPGVEGQIDQLLGGVSAILSKFPMGSGAGKVPPDSNGYITAKVDANAQPATRFAPLDSMSLDFNSQTVLLADAWDAGGSGEDANGKDDSQSLPISKRSVRETIADLAPGTALFGGSLGSIVNTVGGVIDDIPVLDDIFPGFKNFQPGKTSPDVVPADKLATYKE